MLRYCEKAKKFEKTFPHRFDVYSVCTNIKYLCEEDFFQTFVNFSDYFIFTLIQPSVLEKFCIKTKYVCTEQVNINCKN